MLLTNIQESIDMPTHSTGCPVKIDLYRSRITLVSASKLYEQICHQIGGPTRWDSPRTCSREKDSTIHVMQFHQGHFAVIERQWISRDTGSPRKHLSPDTRQQLRHKTPPSTRCMMDAEGIYDCTVGQVQVNDNKGPHL